MDCCVPVFDGILDRDEAAGTAELLSALADPVRLRMVSMLACAPDGTICGCDLEEPLQLAQPTVSHHLRILREAGFVVGERKGRWVHYRLVPERLEQVSQVLTPKVSESAGLAIR